MALNNSKNEEYRLNNQIRTRSNSILPITSTLITKSKADKEGYLVKQGGVVRSWKRRWFSLHADQLFYYKTRADEYPKGVIKIFQRPQRSKRSERPFCFEIPTTQRTFYLQADSEAEMLEWFEILSQIIEQPIRYEDQRNYLYNVKGIDCERCENKVKSIIYSISGVTSAVLEMEHETLAIFGKFDQSVLEAKVNECGFKLKLISLIS
eukprot:TRINITY_DN8096_c0_g1_i1.p1 TRINITY_DN8096_c0_g1~~TRINITY_DN8096_c0_g1_i1.p1  ORF type:complete len:223 (+),score=78.24 TRINITY_DN8096_c0_g1_i1:47-670(+)